MKITADLHTHTIYSRLGHGKGTIEENVRAARERGLSIIGISDHGSDHIIYGVKRKNYFKIRQEIERLKLKYTDIQILLGVEANIISRSGKLAITEDELSLFDYIMAGYHFGTIGESVGTSLTVHFLNGLGARSGEKGEKIKAINTELVIKAVENNRIKVLTHPGGKGGIHVKEVAEVCARHGTLMEINDSHGHLNAVTLREAALTDVQFIIGSDAHRPENVGNYGNALKAAMQAGIELDRIVNIVK